MWRFSIAKSFVHGFQLQEFRAHLTEMKFKLKALQVAHPFPDAIGRHCALL
jgi:hypothetical protein